MATIILGGIGAGIGSIFGPVGAQWGWALGTTIGGIIEASNVPGIHSEVGRLSDLRVSGSSYGTSIPMLWGKGRLPGSIIWVAKDAAGNHLVEHSETESSGGKGMGGRSTVTRYWYTASFAVSFCAGAHIMADGTTLVTRTVTLKRVFFDDVIVWEDGSPDNIVDLNWHDGQETQAKDTFITGIEAANDTPAYRGLAYAVFKDVDLSDYSNRIPNISAELETAAVDVKDALSDILGMVGLTGSAIDVASANISLRGYMLAERISAQEAINPLLQAFDLDAVEIDGALKAVPRGGSIVATVTANDLAATIIDSVPEEHPPKMEHKRSQETDLPGRVTVTYYSSDTAKHFLQTSQEDIRQTANVFNAVTINLPLVLSDDEARRIASKKLDAAWFERDSYKFNLPLSFLKVTPGDCLTVPIGSTTKRLRVLEMEMGTPGELRVTATLDDTATLVQYVTGGTGGQGGAAPTVAVPTDFIAWSGKELRDVDQASPGFYVVGAGDAGWMGATVYWSPDGGTTWIVGGELTTKGTFGVTLNALVAGSTPESWDNTNTLEVDMSWGTLATTSDDAVLTGTNNAVVGAEILGFRDAALVTGTEYDLTRLRRGRRSSTMSGHAIGERFVVANGAILRVNVPEDYVGDTIKVKAVSRYQTLADVTAVDVVIAARTLTDVEQSLTLLTDSWARHFMTTEA